MAFLLRSLGLVASFTVRMADDGKAKDGTRVLLESCHDGDASAVQALVLRDIEWVRSFVRRHLSDALRRLEDSQDVIQELMVTVVTAGPRFVVDSHDDFRRLVATLVLNRLRSQARKLRRNKRDPTRERGRGVGDSVLYLSAAAPVRCVSRPDEKAARAEEITLVRLARDLLDPEQRELVELRDQQLSWAQIGDLVGCEEEAARKRHGIAVQELTRLFVTIKAGRLREVLPE